MNNIKRNQFANCFIILFSIIGFIYSISIYNDIYKVSSIVLMIVFIVMFIVEMILLILKKEGKTKRIFVLVSSIIFITVISNFAFYRIIQLFIQALLLQTKPTSLDPLGLRIVYILIKNYQTILKGIWTTIWMSLAGTVVGLLIAIVFIFLKTFEDNPKDNEFISFIKRVGNCFVDGYVSIFRGTPMMVQAIIIYYFLPGILSTIFNVSHQILNNILSVSVAGFITVTLNTTAYLTEVLRGGLNSINKGQNEAARSLGMTRRQSMIYILLPQTIKNSLPSICNEFIINIKDTSVLSVISVMDLFFIINSINKKNASQDGIFIAAIIYLALTLGISKILRVIEKRMNLVSKPLPSCN